jgi:hypothetical protein
MLAGQMYVLNEVILFALLTTEIPFIAQNKN